MKSGIYKILNKVNGKFYIGSAIELAKRWREHSYHLNRKTHKNSYLQNAWNKYWNISFEFIILELCEPEKLIEREQHWIDTLKPKYNLALFAGSRLGVPMPQSAKDKIGENSKRHMTGRKMLPQTKKALIQANKNRIYVKGKKQSAEQIAKRVKSLKGKARTEETKQKMSEARKGIIFSDAQKLNQSLAAKRRWEAYRAAK